MSEDAKAPPPGAGESGDVYLVGQDALAEWCRALEARIEQLTRENAELQAENERLARRAAEAAAILKSLEEAFVIGRLRAGQPPPEAPPAAAEFYKKAGLKPPPINRGHPPRGG